MTGDSAGGTLITALILKAISIGFRVPDGVFLVYPGMNMNKNYFSTGILLALEDRNLCYNYYFTITNSYVEKSFSLENYLISPIFAPAELLEKFPLTEIMITLQDPLAHDTFRFAEKLLNAKVNVHITELPEGTHGAMFFGNKRDIPSLIITQEVGLEILKKLLV